MDFLGCLYRERAQAIELAFEHIKMAKCSSTGHLDFAECAKTQGLSMGALYFQL